MDIAALLKVELWRVGESAVTIGTLISALLVFAVALAASAILTGGLGRLRRRVDPGGASALYVAAQISRYVIIFIGLVAAGSALGLDLSSLSLFAGALGVGIGLGLQDIVRDFVSGLVLLLDKSIEVGDFVELDAEISGEIAAIGARATTLVTNDNVDVLIPNSKLLGGVLINWTRNRATRRIHVPFVTALGSDKEKVRRAGLEAARAVSFTMPEAEDRRTQVWFVGYGDWAMKFELVVWPTLEAVKRPGRMMAEYSWALDDAMRRHGVEIPLPQQEVRLRSLFGREADAGLASWSRRGEPPA
jgi:small-conductance mechanosensitive channel